MGEANGLIDAHMHLLEMEKKGLDCRKILDHFFSAPQAMALDVATDLIGLSKRMDYYKHYPQLYVSIGIHPGKLPHPNWDLMSVIDQLDAIIGNENIFSALGEMGLDYYRDYGPKEDQIELFEAQMALAATRKLPVIIHNREADDQVLETVMKFKGRVYGIMHCFSADHNFAKKFVGLGYYVSFAGNITYKKADKIKNAARSVPLDRLLVETDSPYLSPQPYRGKPNSPLHIHHTYQAIAELLSVPYSELAEITRSNFRRVLGAAA